MEARLIVIFLAFSLAGCVESPITLNTSIDEILALREDIDSFQMHMDIWTTIISGHTLETDSPSCHFRMYHHHFKAYTLEEIMTGLARFQGKQPAPYIAPYIVCFNYAIDAWAFFTNDLNLIGCPVGVIAYRNRVQGWEHAVLLFYEGREVWLIDPVTSAVYQFDKKAMEAYKVEF